MSFNTRHLLFFCFHLDFVSSSISVPRPMTPDDLAGLSQSTPPSPLFQDTESINEETVRLYQQYADIASRNQQ